MTFKNQLFHLLRHIITSLKIQKLLQYKLSQRPTTRERKMTMGQFIYSIKSHRKIAHLSGCKIIKRISKRNRRSFESFEEAKLYGYHLCNCCPVMAHRYRKERKSVDSLCKDNGITIKLEDGMLYIISRHDCWRIIIKGQNKKMFLYHKNTHSRNDDYKSMIEGYHPQDVHRLSIAEYIYYIIRHDKYRDEHPFTKRNMKTVKSSVLKQAEEVKKRQYKKSYTKIIGTKRYRSEQRRKKLQKRQESILRVYALIEELQAM